MDANTNAIGQLQQDHRLTGKQLEETGRTVAAILLEHMAQNMESGTTSSLSEPGNPDHGFSRQHIIRVL